MQTTTLGELFLDPGFFSIFLAILITVANIVIGVSILPADQRKIRYKLHRNVFFSVLGCYIYFLWSNHQNGTNSKINYIVLLYISLIVPLSRKYNVTAHAIISSVGLVLLALVATLQMG